MPCPQPILDLVARFREHHDAYHSGVYNETQLRRDFLDPFFRELGWDVDNTAGYAESYRDVIHEDQIKVGGAVKAPDYGFRIGGQRKFFLEAKKPSVQIKTDISPAYQLRRYAWSARLPLSILSDFEEFAIYDTRVKPGVNDPAAKARVFYCRYDEYERHWDTIAGIFSRDAILRGGFDKYAATTRGKRGTAEVDSDFLATIEGWRADLAANLALRNPALTQRELNFAVQRVIDRLIFLRICEDRGIEDYERLKKAADGKNIYAALVQLFQQADTRYNSGLFHFHAEKGRDGDLDTLTPGLVIDDALLKPLIRSLYYPDSPYEFSVLSADILGQVYEQFLGKVISLTPGHRARVEDKPEVKKAGGVFYTPTYIVDYIVRQTVGPLLDGKTPRQIESVRVLDPACGSGSFLIGAYQFLLDWYHRHYTSADPDKHARGKNPVLVAAPGGGWMLTTNERKRILLAHIYGVDIDSQAVEVTKLSLLLKVLEGETAQTVQRELIHERVLPDLAGNIKCGNSLIASDFYAQPDLPAMDPDAHLRVNVFDWSGPHGFPHIMKDCGFDAIIGNPPYGAYTGPSETNYLREHYDSPANSLDTFLLFVEKSAELLRPNGMLGVIIPSGWVSTPSSQPLRKIFADNFMPTSFVTLPFDVFDAYVDTIVVTARRGAGEAATGPAKVELVVFPAKHKVHSQEDFEQHKKYADYRAWLESPRMEFLVTCSEQEAELIRKISRAGRKLGDFVSVKRGIETFKPVESKSGMKNPVPAFVGILQRYVFRPEGNNFVDYTPEITLSKPLEYFTSPRILLRQVLSRSLRLQAVYVTEASFTNQSVQSLIPLTFDANAPRLLNFLLGVLNSKLVSWFFVHSNGAARRDDFPKIIIQQTRDIPLPAVGQASELKIAQLVDKMTALNAERHTANTPHEQTSLSRQIEATDAAIDREVYTLYGLTPDEIRLVEQSP